VKPVPLHLVDHPLAHDALTTLRDKRTTPEHFRQAANRISVVLVADALRDIPTVPVTVDTPLGPADGHRMERDVVVVPVLRAGLGMLDAVLAPLADSDVLMIDPMLATGGSAVAALDLLEHAGARTVRLVCIVAAPEGVALVERHHPTVDIYTPVVDRELNAHKYIVPGLGDFGDRLYGTL